MIFIKPYDVLKQRLHWSI